MNAWALAVQEPGGRRAARQRRHPLRHRVAFIDEIDEHAGPIGGKGIGELGATGVDAAVADAVFHATGRRIRELPITPDKLV